MDVVKTQKDGRWVFYLGNTDSLSDSKSGKWMYFFNDREFVSKICAEAVAQNVVPEAKHSDAEEGVACFYINVDDMDAHKRVIEFFINNKLIKVTKAGRYHNLSFKLDSETYNGQYTAFGNFNTNIKLDRFIDLKTGTWILDESTFQSLIPLELKLLPLTEKMVIDKECYGTESASKFVHRAFPIQSTLPDNILCNEAVFWKGRIPKTVLERNLFYIVSLRAIFYLKEGKTPFVRCKTSLMYGFNPLETSDIYDRRNGTWHDKYIDFDGKVKKSFPELTLAREDYKLFCESYDVVKQTILGGCYFQ